MSDARERLTQIEQELNREKFGLERYEAQVKRWQEELKDLDNTGFFSFLVDVEAKKREAQATLTESQSQLDAARANIARLEVEQEKLRESLAQAGGAVAGGAGAGGAAGANLGAAGVAGDRLGESGVAVTGGAGGEIYNDAIHEKACALLDKVEKAIEVCRTAMSESLAALSASRTRAMMATSGRRAARLGTQAHVQADGSNIEMALEVIRENVANFEKLILPVLQSCLNRATGPRLEQLKMFQKQFIDLKSYSVSISAPSSYRGYGLSAVASNTFEKATNETGQKLYGIQMTATYIQESLEEGLLDDE